MKQLVTIPLQEYLDIKEFQEETLKGKVLCVEYIMFNDLSISKSEYYYTENELIKALTEQKNQLILDLNKKHLELINIKEQPNNRFIRFAFWINSLF